MNWYWTSLAFTKNTSEYFTHSISGNNIYAKSMWRPYTSIASYYYTTSLLADLLTKREFLYRQYLEVNNKLINLPNILTANPNNPLLHELKSSFLLIDPITYNSEYSRDFYYNSLSFFKFLLFKNWISSINNGLESLPINTNLINDYLFFYFLNTNGNNKLGNNSDLYKSQFRPLKKGLTNMLRLHSTGAVAMPIDIRLQILASSRDVIHSWAIPSAGVKIDCVPGYTSHRIMIFFNSGIYWGQCMEICGRYHHWMPIIVYFMKRDLFFLWCTHFMSTTGINDMWDINDRQFTDYIRFASYDKNTWLTELSQNL
jgi:heme/copper-type cytochrome/quinol oxidase subunit 2